MAHRVSDNVFDWSYPDESVQLWPPWKMFILLCLLSMALAEPPVGDSYLDAVRSNHGQTPHQQYLPPDLSISSARTSNSFSGLSNQYLPPSSKSISQEYGAPGTRDGLSQEYGLPSTDTSIFRTGISPEYGTPTGRSSHHESSNSDFNQRFSSPAVSQRYDASFRNSPSSVYGPPSLKSSPSTQYGQPQFRSSNEYTHQTSPARNSYSSFRDIQSHSKSIAQEYGTPMASDDFSFRSQNSGNPSQSYGVPARSLSTQYGTPSPRSSVTGFGVSAGPSKAAGVPFGRSLNQDVKTYGTPNFGRSNAITNAVTAMYPSRRTPSQKYGAPSSRTAVPSQEYGVPEDSIANQGYDYARKALENLNQEPASYEFAYKVSDYGTGSDFGHSESRQLDRAEGTYFVLLPDGTKQVVEYEADEDGFKPRISVEPVDSPTALTAEGPY